MTTYLFVDLKGPVPGWFHRCSPNLAGVSEGKAIIRCACGAINDLNVTGWFSKNEFRIDRLKRKLRML